MEQPFHRQEAVAEIRLRRQTRAHPRAGLRDQVELVPVGVRGVHDRRARPEAAAVREQLDRPHAVLGDALLDLTRLLVGVHVQRQAFSGCVAAELLEPVARARAHGVGGDADARAGRAQLLDSAQILRDRVLAEAIEPAARVRDVEQHELDAGLGARLDRRVRLREPEIVELADRRVTGVAHLRVDPRVLRSDVSRGLTPGELEHRVAPGPEVAALGPTPQRPLEGVAVCVHEAWEVENVRHARENTQ